MEILDAITDVLAISRSDAGLSQDAMAKKLQVSKKTIQNWESGVVVPRIDQFINWFRCLHLQPIPYLMTIIHCDIVSDTVNIDIDRYLHTIINDFSSDQKLQLLYCLRHSHGSSPTCILDLLNAHLQSPLSSRINVASIVINNYELAKATGSLVAPELIQPDVARLRAAITEATKSVINGNSEYDILGG